MDQVSVTVPQLQQHQAIKPAAEPRRRITAKVKHAVDLMVWSSLKRDEAAQQAGLKDNSLYVALARPDVRAYYLAQCEVLRTSGRARRIHRLEQIAEQDDNKQAAVNAIRALDLQDESSSATGARSQVAGFVIQIINQGSAHMGHVRSPDAKPLITLDSGSERDHETGK